jgi:hypothetical protein
MTDHEDEFTRRNYLDAVESIATEAARADDPAEYAHEAVDGSRWTFIHYGAQKVLQFSQNRDAAFEELGADAFAGVKSCGELFPRLAFWAMLRDVLDAMPEAEAGA